MNNTLRLSITLLILCSTFCFSAKAQFSSGGQPLGLKSANLTELDQRRHQFIPALDLDQTALEDAKIPGGNRFAAPISVKYNLDDHGQWEDLENGDRIWRLEITAKKAKGIFVVYDNFRLPLGAKFFMYSPDGKQIRGSYTHRNNKVDGSFLTGMIEGESIILEYFEPSYSRGKGKISIEKIYYAYRLEVPTLQELPVNTYRVDAAGYGDALACHVNINCPQGANWQEEKRGIVRILRVFEEGIGWCTGSMINNAREDGTPYVLSAFHCQAGFTPLYNLWRFDYHYESSDCNNPVNEPAVIAILGCQYRAGREESDFLLLELSVGVPGSFNTYFNGWNRDGNYRPDSTFMISHPQGDIKKIALENDPVSVWGSPIQWNTNVTTPANHHLLHRFDDGLFEPGSSGAPLMDYQGYIIGQLHGGLSNCTRNEGFSGRFSRSWNDGSSPDTRLKDWLDPDDTGITTLDPYDPPEAANLSGNILTVDGEGVGNAIVRLGGDATDSLVTGASGFYLFEVPVGGNYTITPEKLTNSRAGLSTFDLVLTAKHVTDLQPFTEAAELIAGDVNNDGRVSTFDIIEMRKMILFIITEFPDGTPSWWMLPVSLSVQDAQGFIQGLNFSAIKSGDINRSADPSN